MFEIFALRVDGDFLHRTAIAVGRAFVPKPQPIFARLGRVGHEQGALVVVGRLRVNAKEFPRAVFAAAFQVHALVAEFAEGDVHALAVVAFAPGGDKT
mgnify:CR=1